MKKNIFDIVLLLALPASGKSEVRKYLEHIPKEKRINEFHMGENVQLDDFIYVHLMRRIDEELEKLGNSRIFFQAADKPYINPKDWGVLINLVNEDYADVVTKKIIHPRSAAHYLFDRIEAAGCLSGIEPRLSSLPFSIRNALAARLENECKEIMQDKYKLQAENLEGKTVVIEFARGGPQNSKMPLPESFGYQYSLSKLSEAILEKAVILYIWVTPEESRRKNEARANPDDPGSILHHGVPIDVMLNDYGCDDINWLEGKSNKKGTITVNTYGKEYYLPIAKFDNRVDKTSFLREDPGKWQSDQVESVHQGLKAALDILIEN